jgi:hypothetical protein
MKQIFGFKNVNDTIWFEETLQPGVLVATAGILDRTAPIKIDIVWPER